MDWLQQIMQEYLPIISEDRLVQASLIVLISAVASVIAKSILNRLQIHGAGRTSSPIDDHMFGVLKKPVSMSILLIGIHLAAIRSQLFEEQLPFIGSVLATIAVFFWVRCVVSFSQFVLKHLSRDDAKFKMVQRHTLPLFQNLAVIIFYGAALYLILVAWDINVSAWVASAGILGLALSFAAKDTLANLFAGVFIMADTPYKIGDFIVLDSGERGMVTHIGIRSTRILTRDDVEIIVPNAIMGNTKVINETAGPHSKFRIRIQVGVAYGSDVKKVRKALLSAIERAPKVEQDPEPRVRFRTFGDSSLNFELLCWVAEPVLRGQVSDILNEAVYDIFNEQGINIPFPQRDVNLRQLPSESE
ncbi:mechanosensitive ion channel family protein [Aliikangiella coralliicola]|uniref:Small-conductance mechanosensitive channel n=1 Tax=Aliikangiella coralliicola TaxID=2592383 RepID=A0A545UEB6_9GAMM|nr:mechanosensitive ion channel family protein [Aliikangiella coralliicola]TQV87824.1 mechanosensitive ion channel family protein [Aliikangiella coralliicola]